MFIENMQDGDGQNERTKEPVGHIDVPGAALYDGAEEHQCVSDPDQGGQDIDRPFELRIFLAAGETHRQGNCGSQDNDLPASEGERCQLVAEQARLTGALNDIVGRCKQGAAAKCENDRIGVQWAQASIIEPRKYRNSTAARSIGQQEIHLLPCRRYPKLQS